MQRGTTTQNLPIEYIFELLQRGHDIDFIAKDAGVQVDSMKRRIDRALKRQLGEPNEQ